MMINKDKCMICLEDCDVYINLSYCKCKIISHENCFKEYSKNLNNSNNSNNINNIKCIICNKISNYDNTISHIMNNSFMNSLTYGLFIMAQNMYFYIDDKFFPENLLALRTISAVLFHAILTLIIFMPYFSVLYINYIITTIKKPYKIYNL